MPDAIPVPGATAVVGGLIARGWTVAVGESLTAGLVAATIAEVPGASAVLRGAVVAYDPDVKARLLDVPADALAGGVVSEDVAVAMARGAAAALGADVGIGTTGVAGPQPHGGEPVGSVWVAVTGPAGTSARHLQLAGDRASVRRQTVAASLEMVAELLAASTAEAPGE